VFFSPKLGYWVVTRYNRCPGAAPAGEWHSARAARLEPNPGEHLARELPEVAHRVRHGDLLLGLRPPPRC
jgi:hypothetical protein